jgi:hypothetical protein
VPTQWLYFVIIVYNLATNIVKLSLLLQYRRLFAETWMRRVCNCGIVFTCLWAIIQVVILAMACLPLASIVPSMKGKCLPATPIWFFTSSMNIVTDFAVLLLPLPSVLKLRMRLKKQKMMLLLVLSIGFL